MHCHPDEGVRPEGGVKEPAFRGDRGRVSVVLALAAWKSTAARDVPHFDVVTGRGTNDVFLEWRVSLPEAGEGGSGAERRMD